MKKLLITFTFLFTFAGSVFAQYPPTSIIKPSLTVRAERDQGYWKLPDAKNYWSWMPEVSFLVTGPIEDASFFTFEFTTPDGKPWYSWDTGPVSVKAGDTYSIESEAVKSWRDKRSSIQTGVFGFKVILKNNLNATSKDLYKGTFKVGKTFAGTPHPDFKNQYAFYVDQDWLLPIGNVVLDGSRETKAPVLNAGMWFRGNFDNSRLSAHLFYNGKQISSTKSQGFGSANNTRSLIAEGDDKREFYWENWNFTFFNVRKHDLDGGFPSAHLLAKNPGAYEIKVLLDGDLVRTAAFTVAADGSIVDNGVSKQNGFAPFGTVMPVKVLGTKEGTLDLNAWKTAAYYGNPLTGFTAQ